MLVISAEFAGAGLAPVLAMKPKQRATWRASTITVMAAFAASCEDNESPVQRSSETDAMVDGGGRVDAGPTSCPAVRPVDGEACSFVGACNYERCGDYPVFEALCEAGKARVRQTSCNPPELPDPWDASTPADAAVDGSLTLPRLDGG